MPEWDAEVRVDGALVRRLVAGQFPQLDAASARLLAEGWDNGVWVLEERWAFRFPRRAIAIPGVEREMALLPRLAPRLPLPIPTPTFRGRPADGYPWPFFGAPLLPGREAPEAALDEAGRGRLAVPLAEFLRSLHAPEVLAAVAGAVELPADPMGRADMGSRAPRAEQGLAELERLGLWRTPGAVRDLLAAARGLPAPEPRALVHGDLHVRHLLVDEAGAPSGVIDWGDVCRGDPAIDLPLLWSFLPPERRATFLDAYGAVTEEQLLRARVLALFLCATLAAYAHHEGLHALEREALGGLERAAVD